MIISGLIFILLGTICLILGISDNNDMEKQISSFLENGKSNTGDVYIAVGFILLILGAILLIAGIVNYTLKNQKNNHSQSYFKNNDYNNLENYSLKKPQKNDIISQEISSDVPMTVAINNTQPNRFELKVIGHCEKDDINLAVTALINTFVQYVNNLDKSKYTNDIEYSEDNVSITVIYLDKYKRKEFISGIKGIIDGLILYENQHPDQLKIIETSLEDNNINWQMRL